MAQKQDKCRISSLAGAGGMAGLAPVEWQSAGQVEPATVDELDRLGVDVELRAQARRWRRCRWVVDKGVPRLKVLGLIETDWLKLSVFEPDDDGDWRIRLKRERRTGRAVLAAVCTPSARAQLDWLWGTLHEYSSGVGPGDDYFRRLGPEGVLLEGFWYSGWLASL